MASPALLTINATASAVWWPDSWDTTFNVHVTAVTATTGVNGTAIVEFAMRSPNVQDVNGTSTPTWFTLMALTGANATAILTRPCVAIRASVVTATATSSWEFNFVQATSPP